jgi:hypothetical protein
LREEHLQRLQQAGRGREKETEEETESYQIVF